MSSYESINQALYRPILSGARYDGYMPSSDCSSVPLGKGDTSFSIQKMKETALKYRHHTERLTKVLLQNETSLARFCANIHSFLFNHFQYKLDGEIQKLRSPACSWASRNEGIDCKSYSIFASTILQNAGISQYMRRIRQRGMYADAYTHVYVIVPKNQKTNKLKDGYYTIDGTIGQFAELPFLKTDDVFISAKTAKPKFSGLANPQSATDIVNTLVNEGYNAAKYNAQVGTEIGKQSVTGTINTVGSTAAAIASCFPGVGQIVGAALVAVTALVSWIVSVSYNPCRSAYYQTDYINEHLKKRFQPDFNAYLKRIETHFKNKTEVLAINDLNTLLKEIDLGYAHYMNEYNTHSGNECSESSLKGFFEFVDGLKKIVDAMLDGLKGAFDSEGQFTLTVTEHQAASSARMWYFIVPSSRNPVQATYRKVTIKDKEEKKGVYPYNASKSFSAWLADNVYVISALYGQAAGENYRREMAGFEAKIREIRRSVWLPVSVQVSEEQPLQKQQFDIYLKYDKTYGQELLKKAQDGAKAYLNKNLAFWEELKKVHHLKTKDEKRRLNNVMHIAQDNADRKVGLENKKTRNLLLLSLIGLGVMKFIKNH